MTNIQHEPMIRKPISMPPDMISKISRIAKIRNVSFAEVVRNAVNIYENITAEEKEIIEILADSLIESTKRLVEKIDNLEKQLDETDKILREKIDNITDNIKRIDNNMRSIDNDLRDTRERLIKVETFIDIAAYKSNKPKEIE